jgi:prevent-host-death family protein
VGQSDIVTQAIPVSQARQKLGELVNEVYKRNVRIIVEKSGIPVVALVALSDLERWLRLEDQGCLPDVGEDEVNEARMSKEKIIGQPPTKEELAQRRKVVARILKLREKASIAPLTTADLVHQVREEEKQSDGGSR